MHERQSGDPESAKGMFVEKEPRAYVLTLAVVARVVSLRALRMVDVGV